MTITCLESSTPADQEPDGPHYRVGIAPEGPERCPRFVLQRCIDGRWVAAAPQDVPSEVFHSLLIGALRRYAFAIHRALCEHRPG